MQSSCSRPPVLEPQNKIKAPTTGFEKLGSRRTDGGERCSSSRRGNSAKRHIGLRCPRWVFLQQACCRFSHGCRSARGRARAWLALAAAQLRGATRGESVAPPVVDGSQSDRRDDDRRSMSTSQAVTCDGCPSIRFGPGRPRSPDVAQSRLPLRQDLNPLVDENTTPSATQACDAFSRASDGVELLVDSVSARPAPLHFAEIRLAVASDATSNCVVRNYDYRRCGGAAGAASCARLPTRSS
jgi:hypothetical protein